MHIEQSAPADNITVGKGLDSYNEKAMPFITPVTRLDFHIKNAEGKISGGIVAVLGYWAGLEIKVLWVDEKERGKGYGTAILKRAEEEAVKLGGKVAVTDTFDFQAKDFYEKMVTKHSVWSMISSAGITGIISGSSFSSSPLIPSASASRSRAAHREDWQ